MKITAQEEYGLRCLLRLARAHGEQPLTIPEIAATEGLSVPYVAKLLSVLRQAGLIESVRGRSGGYRLTGSPADVRLAAVMGALGEPLFDDPGYCQRHAGPETNGSACVHLSGCTLRVLWLTLERWMRGILDEITLDDLIQSEGRIVELLRERLKSAVLEPSPAQSLLPLVSSAAN
jgi:Rrf2 family protein